MQTDMTKVCRKCRAENPPTNMYCKRCGAVLGVATSVIRAQRAPLVAKDTGIKYRYILLGVPMMVGIAAAVTGVSFALGLRPIQQGASISTGILNLALMTAGLFIVSFFPGGLLLSRMSRTVAAREAVVSSLLAVLMLGMIGSTVTFDLLIAASIALVPSVGAAWFGARIGGTDDGTEDTQ